MGLLTLASTSHGPPLELPIDHFRLLGVSPGNDAQAILHMLHQRLDRVPEQGFSQETLEARAELLRASADLLTDPDRRAAYESRLTSLADRDRDAVPALDLPAAKEVAGLLLLLEAGQPLECFSMASRSLQPPQAPVLGSSRETDLSLLAGNACLQAAEEFRHQRRFEAAARTLEEGLHLLQRMGQLPHLREAMNRELERLIPYRVLDLLSRDLSAVAERQEGLQLLEQLVERRGGLEGDGDPGFGRKEFQAFFKQIRSFLTVQEQVDLFSRWGDAGSGAADFLATTALTASGFAQRKPERIAAARTRLLASGRSGIEPLLANLNLLLGDVESARTNFDLGASEELRQWASRQSEEPLGQLCAYCRDWLSTDVLPGYRDLDAEPDLDAYFSDQDVLAYVDREDRRRGRSFGPFSTQFRTPWGDPLAAAADPAADLSLGDWPAPLQPEGQEEAEEAGVETSDASPASRLPPLPWRLLAVGGIVLLALAGLLLLRSRRPEPAPPAPGPASVTPGSPAGGTAEPEAPSGENPAPAAATAAPRSALPLEAASPSTAQISALLEAWLSAKQAVLAGEEAPDDLEGIARPSLVDELKAQRRADAARERTQRISASLRDLSIESRSANRIAARATLSYRDRLLEGDGEEVEVTPPTTLVNTYVFGRDNGVWRLAAFSPAD